MTRVVSFFNNKGGVGKTSLVYHLTYMYAELQHNVLAVDLDPQANLTSALLDEDRFTSLWPEGTHPDTIAGAIEPLRRGLGDIATAPTTGIGPRIYLLPGDLELSLFEDELSQTWPRCLDRDERAFRVTSAFWRLIIDAAIRTGAEMVLVDVGPNLGAINRAALVASDDVVVPLSPDLFSIQGLRNLGPTLRRWREEWSERRARNPEPSLEIPVGSMQPLGYVVQQHGVRLDRPARASERWIRRIPEVYRSAVLNQGDGDTPRVEEDANCLAMLKHYHSLVPLAQESRKPVFLLRPADGAIGAHQTAVQNAYRDFEALAVAISERLLARPLA